MFVAPCSNETCFQSCERKSHVRIKACRSPRSPHISIVRNLAPNRKILRLEKQIEGGDRALEKKTYHLDKNWDVTQQTPAPAGLNSGPPVEGLQTQGPCVSEAAEVDS